MKVLAVNSSPRSERQSKTQLMLDPLIQGMREAGAEVEVVYLRNKTVKNCIGCFSCWTKTPGVCILDDEMTNELFPKWLAADLVVYATPIYHYTLNATMKAFLERTLPALEPFFEEQDGHMYHPQRQKPPAAVMLSVASFSQEEVFDSLSSYVNTFFGEDLVAEIYRPAAELMVGPFSREQLKDILDATKQAGRELVESMQVLPETLARIRQSIDSSSTASLGNLIWEACIAEGITIGQFFERRTIPRPNSIKVFMQLVEMLFTPDMASDVEAVLQFVFSGETEGSCYFIVDKGTLKTVLGAAENPDLTIEAPFELWMDIMTGEADGQQMFMEQKYRAEGNLFLLMQMNQLFVR